jgi:Tfp pilus assembly ATPase PilU
MQSFDAELERMAREGVITIETALAYASNQGNLRLALSDLIEAADRAAVPDTSSTMSGRSHVRMQ